MTTSRALVAIDTFSVHGAGLYNNMAACLEHDWKGPVWRHWLGELVRYHTLVRYDERGCGLSDWDDG